MDNMVELDLGLEEVGESLALDVQEENNKDGLNNNEVSNSSVEYDKELSLDLGLNLDLSSELEQKIVEVEEKSTEESNVGEKSTKEDSMEDMLEAVLGSDGSEEPNVNASNLTATDFAINSLIDDDDIDSDVKKILSSSRDVINDIEMRKIREESVLEKVKLNSGDSNQQVSYGYFTDSNPPRVEVNNGRRNKYLIIPDLHLWYKNITSRKDYLGELDEALSNIFMYVKSDDTINNVILSGDIYHRGFSDIDSTRPIKKYWMELKSLLNKRSGELYAVIGNHEFSYSKNNPFWLQDDSIFKTPEDIIDNGVHLYLESYHTPKSIRTFRSTVDSDICITHNEVLPPEMATFVRNESGRRVFTSSRCMSFSRYNVKALFVGHMHQIVESYVVMKDDSSEEQMRVQYLGSIGRTSVEEIDNEFRYRDLPVVEVGIDSDGNEGSGKFRIEHLPLELREYHDTVISSEVAKNREIREKRKQLNELKLEKVTDDPVQEIKERYNHEMVNTILDCANEDRVPVEVIDLLGKVKLYLSI